MKRGSTLFLKLVLLIIAVAVIVGMIVFPQTEGHGVDPFIIYIYLASTPFFIGLYQAYKLLNLIDANKAFSQAAVNTLRNMKFAALSLIGFIALALIFIRFVVQGEDSAGPTMLGLCLSLAFGAIATAAGVFQKLFQNAVDLKEENDLTV
jgi:hypothetical protein